MSRRLSAADRLEESDSDDEPAEHSPAFREQDAIDLRHRDPITKQWPTSNNNRRFPFKLGEQVFAASTMDGQMISFPPPIRMRMPDSVHITNPNHIIDNRFINLEAINFPTLDQQVPPYLTNHGGYRLIDRVDMHKQSHTGRNRMRLRWQKAQAKEAIQAHASHLEDDRNDLLFQDTATLDWPTDLPSPTNSRCFPFTIQGQVCCTASTLDSLLDAEPDNYRNRQFMARNPNDAERARTPHVQVHLTPTQVVVPGRQIIFDLQDINFPFKGTGRDADYMEEKGLDLIEQVRQHQQSYESREEARTAHTQAQATLARVRREINHLSNQVANLNERRNGGRARFSQAHFDRVEREATEHVMIDARHLGREILRPVVGEFEDSDDSSIEEVARPTNRNNNNNNNGRRGNQ